MSRLRKRSRSCQERALPSSRQASGTVCGNRLGMQRVIFSCTRSWVGESTTDWPTLRVFAADISTPHRIQKATLRNQSNFLGASPDRLPHAPNDSPHACASRGAAFGRLGHELFEPFLLFSHLEEPHRLCTLNHSRHHLPATVPRRRI
jgi:hypothetical protein